MDREPTADWPALRDRIAALRVDRCRMVHERVLLEGGSVVRIHRGEAEPVLGRVGLCPPEVRERRLACGHTMARYLLADALEALRAAGELDDASHGALHEELDGIGNAIHLLDHRKGEAERSYALLAEQVEPADPSLAAAGVEVRECERLHDAYADRLRALRDRVLRQLDAAAARAGPAPSSAFRPVPEPSPPSDTESG